MINNIKNISIFLILLLLSSCGDNVSENNVEVNNGEKKIKIDNTIETEKKSEVKEISKKENILDEETKDIEEEKIENTGKLTCENKYDNLLEKKGKNYSDCYFNKPDTSSCDLSDTNKGKINLIVIFDSSGSMGAYIGKETMMNIAKDKIANYVSDLDKDTNLSFVLYGHKGSSAKKGKQASCDGVENIYTFSDSNRTKLSNDISAFKPNGWTPMAKSLIEAKNIIKQQTKENDKNIILLVSDGKETCGGNPVIEALKISKTQNTFIDVIGFNVEGDTQKQLMNIAKSGNGNYYDVKSAIDFEDTFNKTKNFLDTMSCGASIAATELHYGAEAINKYYSCMYTLNEEKVFMLADAPKECIDYFEDKIETRYEKYEREFEPILKQGESILNNFSNEMEKLEEQMDSDEDDDNGDYENDNFDLDDMDFGDDF